MKRRKVKDMTGQKFGRLTAISHVGYKRKYAMWKCQCECGKIITVLGSDLRRGNTKSCGCFKKDRASETHYIHGMDGTPTYKSWMGAKSRCCNPDDCHYKDYGGRGIMICGRWINSFENFLEDMGKRPQGKTIDRVNNDGNYSPENCRWSTPKEQSRNQRTNRLITYQKRTECLSVWAEILNINYETLRSRLARHLPEVAFNM